MILKQEELLSRYFEHRMSADEEQNFLIQLAASDDLRTAFRSHLELQKAIRDDKDDLRAVAQVRTRTLTALGLSAAAVTPFIEQELMKKQSPADRNPQMASLSPKVPVSFLSKLAHSRAVLLSAGLVVGFTAGSALFSGAGTPVPSSPSAQTRSVGTVVPQPVSVAAPATNSPTTSVERHSETIHQPKGLNIQPHPATSASSRTDRVDGSAGVAHEVAVPSVQTPLQTINRAKPGRMTVKSATVTKTPDSTTKE